MSNPVDDLQKTMCMTAEMFDMKDSAIQLTLDAPHALNFAGVCMMGIEAYHAGAVPRSTYDMSLATYQEIVKFFRHCPRIKGYLEASLIEAQKGKPDAD